MSQLAVSPQTVPYAILKNGEKMPMIGLGTWRLSRHAGDVVRDAISVGYRHIDCAHIYRNEQEVGEALKQLLDEGIVKRSEIFVTSKLWNTFHHPRMVRAACETTLKHLQLSYLDNYLIHWPMAYKDGEELYPKDENDQIIFSSVDFVDTWKAMEQLVDDGLCLNIGISNFNISQIKRLLSEARIAPSNLQIECHPYLNQHELMEFCKAHHIAVTAYSPLGSPDTPYQKPGDYALLQNPKILQLAAKLGKSVAQVLIRYQLQRGNIVIPKSNNKEHMAENLRVFDFCLSPVDIEVLDGLDIGGRFLFLEPAKGHPHHPFE